nr:zinc finger, CCHC-type [Tanacetum cinerariifolium]
MGDANPIRNLGDYSKPSHEGYMTPLNSPKEIMWYLFDLTPFGWCKMDAHFADFGRTVKLCNDIFMFQQHQRESLSEAWTHFKDLLQKVPHDGIDLWLKVQIFYDYITPPEDETINQSTGAHMAPMQPTQVNKITSLCEFYSGPHDTQYCIENPEQAFVEYASSHTNEVGDARLSKFKADFKQKQSEVTNKINMVLKAITDQMAGALPVSLEKSDKNVIGLKDVINLPVNVNLVIVIDTEVPISEGSPDIRTESQMETYKTVSQDIRDQLNVEAEAVQIILTGIDNDIYSIVDACPNACEMWKAIERLKQEFLNQITTSCYQEQRKKIVNSPQPIYDQETSMVAEDDETSKEKEIDKLIALISLSFKKIYKPTNNNLRTSSNTIRANQDNSPRINRSTGYENQRIGNVARAKETIGSTVVQKSRIQCYNCKEFGHVARECQKPKRVKDAAYHREKMLLYQELEAHYMYMAQLQEVSPDTADSGPIFDDEPLQKVSNDDHYNVFAMESEHPEQSKSVHDIYPIEQDTHNVIIDSLGMSYDREEIDQNDDDNDLANERELLASLIEKLKCEIDENKNRNKFLET